jgi:hypothetical protein
MKTPLENDFLERIYILINERGEGKNVRENKKDEEGKEWEEEERNQGKRKNVGGREQ